MFRLHLPPAQIARSGFTLLHREAHRRFNAGVPQNAGSMAPLFGRDVLRQLTIAGRAPSGSYVRFAK